ncbi:MAG: Polyphosphate:AMP phosphotransferase [Bacteroidota bacterium]|nr:Polyphosphate:AMP phosphotransferase [Bacteroidota bacterium]
MKLHTNDYKVKSGKDFNFSKFKTSSKYKKPEQLVLSEMMVETTEKLADLQYKLYAENTQSLLIILQGMDSSGKDGVIKYLVGGINPQGVVLHSFKHPNDQELKHDYLWRHYLYFPEQGQIGIFNRSHYENVLISKVHPEIVLAERIPGINKIDQVDKKFWEERYQQINEFEKIITQTGTHIIKFFLHISKEEQCERFLDRVQNKDKHWKFSAADITERQYWDKYQDAYKDALKHTHTKDAPWYVIPADQKWYAHLLIGKIVREKLDEMNPTFPPLDRKEAIFMNKAKKELLKEKNKK